MHSDGPPGKGGDWRGLLRRVIGNPAAPAPPPAEPPVANGNFPKTIEKVGLPRDPALEEAAKYFQSRSAAQDTVFYSDQACWLSTDHIWEACRERLGLEGVSSALEANARIEKEGGIELSIPITYGNTQVDVAKVTVRIFPEKATIRVDDIPGRRTTSLQALVDAIPQLKARFSSALASAAPVYQAAKKDISEYAKSNPTNPYQVMNYS